MLKKADQLEVGNTYRVKFKAPFHDEEEVTGTGTYLESYIDGVHKKEVRVFQFHGHYIPTQQRFIRRETFFSDHTSRLEDGTIQTTEDAFVSTCTLNDDPKSPLFLKFLKYLEEEARALLEFEERTN